MIDLNCDMGELADAALEAALMEHVTSASIACGAHAGDGPIMQRTVRMAVERGVRVGAHPGYPDRANFGRLEMSMTPEEIEASILEQIDTLSLVARPLGAAIVYVKPHGALYNVAVKNPDVARAIGAAVKRWNPEIWVFGLAGSQMLDVWREMGLHAVGEGFADRCYEADGTLRSRKLPDALITDPATAAAQAVRLARNGGVETICVHGDTPGAVEILRACKEALFPPALSNA